MVRDADDIADYMGWPRRQAGLSDSQTSLLPQLSSDEQRLYGLLKQGRQLSIDELVGLSGFPMPRVASILFNLEMQKVVRVLPGHLYESID